nr:immunoglobulin light chain junction region [Macaca mulatta]
CQQHSKRPQLTF